MPHRPTSGAAALLVAALMSAQATTAQPRITVGQPIPDLRLPTLDGEVRSIADYHGTKVVLHVFASW